VASCKGRARKIITRRSLYLLLMVIVGLATTPAAGYIGYAGGRSFYCEPARFVRVGPQDPVVLEPGKPIERELSAGQRHSYRIALSEGQYVELEIRQQGIEVGVSLKLPNGKTLPIYSPFGNKPDLSFTRVAESTGIYQCDVYASSKAPPGRYKIRIAELHPATESERALQEARDSWKSIRNSDFKASMLSVAHPSSRPSRSAKRYWVQMTFKLLPPSFTWQAFMI